jgi:hypothetical protein
MGIYDTFGKRNIQLKRGIVGMNHYNVGDTVDLPNGIYIGYEGVVVIEDKCFIMECDIMFTKWGAPILPKDVIDEENPVNIAIKEFQSEPKGLRVFRMNEYETVVAFTSKQAKEYYAKEFPCQVEDGFDDEIADVTDNEEKVWWQFSDVEELEKRIQKWGQLEIGIWGGDLSTLLTFKQVLEIYAGPVPNLLTTTEI